MNLLALFLLSFVFLEETKGQVESCQPSSKTLDLGTLCSADSPRSLEFGDSVDASFNFSSCCPSPSLSARRLLGITSDTLPRQMQSTSENCQSYEIIDPFCPDCNLETISLSLTVQFSNPQVLSNETCCSECNCWGDPRCTSFNGTRANWVVCDDRNSQCEHGPVRCENRKDPWGGSCEFVKRSRKPESDDPQPWWYDWDTSGSPCQATPVWEEEQFPYMVMYDGEGQVINLTLGERGIISSVQVTEESTDYTLDARDCFVNANSSAWTVTGDSFFPSTWNLTVESSTLYRWNIQNLDKTVFTSIVCYQSSDYRSRLDITVRQIASSTSDLNSVQGFCKSGIISENFAESRTLSIEEDDACLRKELGTCVEACKALVDSSCSETNLQANVREWCSINDLTGIVTNFTIDSIDTCISYICGDGNCFDECSNTSQNWADLVCQIDSMNIDRTGYDEAMYRDCAADIAETSWFQYAADRQAYIVRNFGYFSDAECLESVSEYPSSKPYPCAIGAQIQTKNPDTGEWEDEFFIPVENPLCENATLSALDYPNLVTRPIKVSQCDMLGSDCAVENDCLPVPEISVTIMVENELCPTPAPTIAPTEPPITIENTTCAVCTTRDANLYPQICVTETSDFQALSDCDRCCSELNATVLNLTDYGYCRTQETERAYCDLANATDVEYCENLLGNNGVLSLNITYTNTANTTSCCPECIAYGDPELIPFNETEYVVDAWVICDGRSPDTCKVDEGVCTAQLDHEGNNCTYDSQRAAWLEQYGQFNIGAIGSPCIASNQSSPAVMELYTLPEKEMSIKTTLGERAVMVDARFTFANTTSYTLSANTCFDGPGSGWTKDGSNVTTDEVAAAFSFLQYDTADVNSVTRGASRTWVLEFNNSLHVQITCQKMIAQGGDIQGLAGYRLDFDHIIDTNEERAFSTNSTGFCPTAEIDFMEATRTDLSDDSAFSKCTWMRMNVAVALAKSLVDPTATYSETEIRAAVETWCNTANVYQTKKDPTAECVKAIWTSGNLEGTGKKWAYQYCKAIGSSNPEKCRNGILENTYSIQQSVEAFGTGKVTTDNTCSKTKTDEYTTSTDVCEQGFFIDYFDESTSEWIQELFVPSLELPCSGGTIDLTYEKRPHLFNNRFRIRQCDPSVENGCNLATSCSAARAYTASYRFSQDATVCGDTSGSS